jgi:branched-chain amino acid transport system permease protein
VGTAVNILVAGVVTGCIYGLIGVGFVIVYRATGVVSFAQGAFMVIGSELIGTLVNHGLEFYLALIVMCVALFFVGAAIYWLAFSRLVGREPFVTAVATIGLGTLVETIAILLWGSATITIPLEFSYKLYHVVGSLNVDALDLFTVAVTIVTFLAIFIGLQRTTVGLRMRAVANSGKLAACSGINVVRISALAWGIAGLTGGIAGVVYLLGSQPDPGSVYSLGLAAFPAILLGGFDSILGCLVGGVLIGVLQSALITYIGGSLDWSDFVSYLALLAVLLIRPQGLFGSKDLARL